jgi:rare lipoprotein A
MKLVWSLILTMGLCASLKGLSQVHPGSNHSNRSGSSGATVDSVHASKKNKKKGLIGTQYEGIASYYGEEFRGKRTHTDEVFDPDKLTAACNKLPLKTWVKVTNLRNNRTVTLWINDRMHPKNKRLIDVSAKAARELKFYARGLTKVRVEVVPRPKTPPSDSTGVKKPVDRINN